MDDNRKIIEELKKEIGVLKERLNRIEGFLKVLPKDDDELLEEAKKIIMEHDRVSASLLQRRLSIGYARAARLLDLLEKKGIVGPGEGAKPRKVLLNK
jgi:S-DNA-T family DNA segregation ATPase FtsK/SpoIIIE